VVCGLLQGGRDLGRTILQGPDDAVRLWWRLAARKETASGSDPFLIKGNVPAATCSECGHGEHHEVPAKKGQGFVDRCKRCGWVWSSRIEYVLRGMVQTTRRPHAGEVGLAELADLEHAIAQVPERDRLLYGLYLFTDRSEEYVAERAAELSLEHPTRWPMPSKGFSREGVRWAVKRARKTLSEALIKRSLMARRVPVLMAQGTQEVIDVLEPMPATAIVPADPAAWFGLLQDVERDPVDALVASARGANLIRLSRSSTRELGKVYRQVPMRQAAP